MNADEFAAAVRRIGDGVSNFAADMKRQGIHVGLVAKPLARCVTCGDLWPCAAARPKDDPS